MSDTISTATSVEPRNEAPEATGSEVAAVTAGDTAFAFDLYRQLRAGAGNLFVSPFSISLALAMTYAGARGKTEGQMAETLHFSLPQARLHPAFNALDLELARRGVGAEGKDGQGFRLHIVNALWGQEGYVFLDQFLDTLAENYGAGLRLLDFAGAPERSRLAINAWISEKTEDRIPDLIPAGAIDAMTRLVLTNAIYFNAAWARPFRPEHTADAPFYPLEGESQIVPMMKQTARLGYAAGAVSGGGDFQALELPYDGHELSMLILLPAAGHFAAVEGALDASLLEGVQRDLAPRRIELSMPRFRFESAFMLKPALAAMGMPDAFCDAADFSGMDGGRTLQISDVIHQAFVEVDEAGTEAAAATAVIMMARAMPLLEEPLPVTLDRPFLFLIRDIATGSILFIGRVVDPGSGAT